MNCNAWTLALAGAGLVSLPTVIRAEEKPNPVWTGLSSTTISGYIDTSVQWNAGTGNANTPAYAFGGPGKADGFNLNVVELTLEKPMDTSQEWGAGYKVDLFLGPDAVTLATPSSGALSRPGPSHTRPTWDRSPSRRRRVWVSWPGRRLPAA